MMTKKTTLNLTLALFVAVLSLGLVAFTYVDIADGVLSGRYGPPNRPGQPDGQQAAGSTLPDGVPAGNGSYGVINGAGVGIGTAFTELTPDEEAALMAAIEEEYGARALYEGVIDQFGNAAPFSMIARSEQQHAAALIRLAEKYGVEVPAYPGA